MEQWQHYSHVKPGEEMGELVKPGKVAELLAAYGIHPRKSLGQHFLVDGNVLRRQLEAASLSKEHSVLEIGPGLGALTEELLEMAKRVVAVEADESLCRVLMDILGSHPRLSLVQGDSMKTSLGDLFGPEEKVVMVSNLPYNVATPTIFKALREVPGLELLVVTVQRELAERYCASPGKPEYGSVSVKLQHLCEVEKLAVVPPTVFLPPPKVESALVRMTPRRPSPDPDESTIYFHFVDRAFSHRRKTLANNLAGQDGLTRERVFLALDRLGKDPMCRAEQLSPADLYRLFRELSAYLREK